MRRWRRCTEGTRVTARGLEESACGSGRAHQERLRGGVRLTSLHEVPRVMRVATVRVRVPTRVYFLSRCLSMAARCWPLPQKEANVARSSRSDESWCPGELAMCTTVLNARTISGLACINRRQSDITSAALLPAGATMSTSPMLFASSAVIRSAPASKSRASWRLTRWASRVAPPHPVVTPMRDCANWILAVLHATRKSQAVITSAPPPIANPSMWAMEMQGALCSKDRVCCMRTHIKSPMGGACSFFRMEFRSPPVQNDPLLPSSTTHTQSLWTCTRSLTMA
mmetsp:Transcript_47173/g.118814  ORF Transcript_47173/g.118814 Transcript_47173/m.118814 type:complete len:283 (+) Transcript_47173:2311-3159(+)